MRTRRRFASTLAVIGLVAGLVGVASPAQAATATVRVAPTAPTYYPYDDGYGDGVTIFVSALAPAGESATGTLRVLKGSTVVASWPLTTAERRGITWDGLRAGVPVYGTLTLRVDAERGDGTVVTGTGTVVASTKKLVARTWTKTVDAMSANYGMCGWDNSEMNGVRCTFLHAYDPVRRDIVTGIRYTGTNSSTSDVGELVPHAVQLPSAVRSTLAPVNVRVTARYSVTGGAKRFDLVSCGAASGGTIFQCPHNEAAGDIRTITGSGTYTTSSSRNTDQLPAGQWAGWAVAPYGKTSVTVTWYTVKVTYYVLG